MKQFLFIFFIFIGNLTAQNKTVFDEANMLYNNGNYTEAISKYEAILKTNQHSAELYYNLGNAHYKLNNIAPSIYYYEKALQLKPNDKDILNNIVYAKKMTVDDIQTVPQLGLSKFFNQLTHALTYDNWAKLAIGLMVVFVVLFLFYFFTYSTVYKRLTFVLSFVFLFLALSSVGLAFQKQALDKKNNPAIVFAQESEVKTEPNLGSPEAFLLHEGTKVQVLDTINNWKKIKLEDGKTGWILSDDIKLLNVF
ncbi:tetratricopeptide repeat protein [Olleya aquimaris]|uniref:SH3 domain-containing protein n=1 Tax=Olleya aquimaris TaxID=639310 RepID=A0A327R8Z8_9FLAO|nr:tetratricopeptide repeat protein [Olleya aquimaris]RAJ12094.1 SH3 domain-containing protein [Olleya aquimaris]